MNRSTTSLNYAIPNNSLSEVKAPSHCVETAEQFGDSVEVTDDFRWEWLGIPHIFDWPFYVYAYAFGQLLVLALYSRYKQEGEGFEAAYFRLLSAGESAEPVALLEGAGIDVRQPAFWQGGYDVIASLIDELEALG